MGGALSERVAGWRETLVGALALLEAELDFSDEGDVAGRFRLRAEWPPAWKG